MLRIGSKLTGIKFAGSAFSPFFWTGVMFADFHAERRWPKEKLSSNSQQSAGDIKEKMYKSLKLNVGRLLQVCYIAEAIYQHAQ